MNKGILAIVGVLAAMVLGFGAFSFASTYNGGGTTTYANGTKINGVDCSGKTTDQAAAAISDARNAMKIEITENGEHLATIKDVKMKYDTRAELEEALHDAATRIYIPILSDEMKNVEFDMKVTGVSKRSAKKIKSYKFLNNTYKTKTRNAYVDLSNSDFNIVEEVYGDNVDKDRFVEKIKTCYSQGITNLEYKPADYYAQPTVKSDDPDLLKYQEKCKKYYSQEITYEIHTGDVTITPKELSKLIKFKNDKLIVKKEAVDEYVLNLAYKYNTVGITRNFKTANGKMIKVEGGTYGYAIDLEKEAEQLTKDLKSRKNVKRKPIYAAEPYAKGKDDIGDTFLEVNISSQTMYYVKDGKIAMSSPVVTGNVLSNHGTIPGVYSVAYLDRDATLKGRNADGSKYESHVAYWMPFNDGQGFHDAPWRSAFGGSIYRGAGSHGCVNMPPANAKKLFNMIEAGYPVVVHY
jgi:hypothetical protein